MHPLLHCTAVQSESVQSGIGFSQYTRLPPERNEIFPEDDCEVAGLDKDFVESLRADLVSNDD